MTSPPTADAPRSPAPLARAGRRAFAVRLGLFLTLLVAVDHLVAAALLWGLRRYYGMDRPARILCVGHSRTVLGVDTARLSAALGQPVAKYAMDGVNTYDRGVMVRHFLRMHPEVRLVLYDVESTSFTTAKLSENSYRLLLPFLEDPDIRVHVRRQCGSLPRYWAWNVLRTSRYDEATVNRAVRGWFRYDENLKRGTFDAERLRQRIAAGYSQPVRVDADNKAAFEATLEFIREKGCCVVLWHPPTVDLLDDIDHDAREAVRSYFRGMAERHPGVAYLEYVKPYRSAHDLFYDALHVNPKGREVVTSRLAQDIRALPCYEELSLPRRGAIPPRGPNPAPAVR